MYHVEEVESFTGRQGYGFSAVLYRDGKRVARVIDEGNGGPILFYWCDNRTNGEEVTISEGDKKVTVILSPEEAAFVRHAQQQEGDILEPAGMCVVKLVAQYEAASR